ncbi:MAG: hypothetical protein R2991_15345 [Thermoanaerobaculia bacterium]
MPGWERLLAVGQGGTKKLAEQRAAAAALAALEATGSAGEG